MSDLVTRNILKRIREVVKESENIDLPEGSDILAENSLLGEFQKTIKESSENEKPFVISQSSIQFGTVRASQEDMLKKTIGDVSLKSDALKYYPKIHDLVINGEVSGLGVTFQFRYKDPSGDGCYIWAEGLQLSDSNLRTIDKIRDAFLNWKQSLIEDGDLLQKLDKEANKEV